MTDLQALFDQQTQVNPNTYRLGPNAGKKMSAESREKMRQAKLGQSRAGHTQETKLKMSKSHQGKLHSEQTRAKMSQARQGRATWNKGISNPSAYKPVMTPYGLFASRNLAALALGVNGATINYRIRKFPEQYYYIQQK